MSIKRIAVMDDVPVEEISLTSPMGVRASVLTWGATVRDLVILLPGGQERHVVLGYKDIQFYRRNTCFLGATAGRYANRIAEGKFSLDGKSYQLTQNEKGNHLHGGTVGIAFRPWHVIDHDVSSVTLALTSPDGDQGYPGTVELTCLYRLDDPMTFHIEMSARTDAPTILNLAHHSYFRLGGKDCRDHSLWINAGFMTPVDQDLIPTGEILSVAGTQYDFTTMRPIRSQGDMFDINYVLNRAAGNDLELAATVLSPQGDLRFDLLTTEPGLQFYNGFALSETGAGLDGTIIRPYGGLCLEPQNFPNAPNIAHFPSSRLDPGEEYRQVTEYRFGIPGL